MEFFEKNIWWVLPVAMAGLAWGTYVPIIFYGGQQLPPAKPGDMGGRLMAILCVGGAYFVLAVLIPLVLFVSGQASWPEMKTTGLVFSSLAGVAGALGAICVVFASAAAVESSKGDETFKKADKDVKQLESEVASNPERKEELQPALQAARDERSNATAKYRMWIAPLIFGLAPLINTLISLVWHPATAKAGPFSWEAFGIKDPPHWTLYLGIVFVGLGSFLVLLSKELGELHSTPAPVTTAPAPPSTGDMKP